MMAAEPIAIIEKNKLEEMRVVLGEYRSHRFVDVRIYCDPYADHGQGRVATKKGIACPLPRLPELIQALQQAEARARELGLLPKPARQDLRVLPTSKKDTGAGGAASL